MALRPGHFLNRELSWLQFNQRVLDEALDAANPLLERVKFFCIVSSNLDEFFEVRVAGLKQQMDRGVVERSSDGQTPAEIFEAVVQRVRKMVDQLYACWRGDLRPTLARHGIRFLDWEQLPARDRAWVGDYYRNQVRPVLTPMVLDPAHPFPRVLNTSLNLIVEFDKGTRSRSRHHLAVVQVPPLLPRLVRLPGARPEMNLLSTEQIIARHLDDLFPGIKLCGCWAFRVTRNSDLYIDEQDTASLLKALEQKLTSRHKGDAVRLEIAAECPEQIREGLLAKFELTEQDAYLINGPLDPASFMTLCEGAHFPELRDPPFVAPVARPLKQARDIFSVMRQRDILLHHPYESFNSVVGFLDQAAEDPNVLAIKQTLYRTGGDPHMVGALMKAVGKGKQVTVIVELRARFDEANNIEWARRLKAAGVQIVYGMVGYKIHAKATLVVRREGKELRRYVHLSTGNYNPKTAQLYTDIGLLTCREDFAEDVTNLFNLLTGTGQLQGMKKLMVAPFDLHARLLGLIGREAEHARHGRPARLIAKMNSLADEAVIEALYAASQAGVTIDLIVRGICCLRPGVRNLSENISVRSIVDRFLEHSRVFYFENGGQPEVFLGSADWMARNFFRRIEVMFPIEDDEIRDRLRHEILAVALADNTHARCLQRDGAYRRVPVASGARQRRSQAEFISLALAEAQSQPNGAGKSEQANEAHKLKAADRFRRRATIPSKAHDLDRFRPVEP